MAKTNFVPQTPVSAAFLNAINNPTHVAVPSNDGELPLIRDVDLDSSASALLARSNTFLNAFSTIGSSNSLFATISAGTVVLGDGTAVQKTQAQVGPLPANTAQIFVWINPSGVFVAGTVAPSDGSVLIARLTTDAVSVTGVVDLRPRFKISTQEVVVPEMIGKLDSVLFPVSGFEYTDERGWKWLNLSAPVYLSRAGASGDAQNDGYEQLFKRLWLSSFTIANSSRTPVPRTTADGDWSTGRLLFLPSLSGRVGLGAGTHDTNGAVYGTGDRGGQRDVVLTSANLTPHNHAISDPGHAHNVSDPGHAHGYRSTIAISGSRDTAGSTNANESDRVSTNNQTNVSIQVAATGITGTQSTGSGTPFNVLNPYFVETRLLFTGVRVVA